MLHLVQHSCALKQEAIAPAFAFYFFRGQLLLGSPSKIFD